MMEVVEVSGEDADSKNLKEAKPEDASRWRSTRRGENSVRQKGLKIHMKRESENDDSNTLTKQKTETCRKGEEENKNETQEPGGRKTPGRRRLRENNARRMMPAMRSR